MKEKKKVIVKEIIIDLKYIYVYKCHLLIYITKKETFILPTTKIKIKIKEQLIKSKIKVRIR